MAAGILDSAAEYIHLSDNAKEDWHLLLLTDVIGTPGRHKYGADLALSKIL